MKNNNFRYLNNENVHEEDVQEDTISEQTDEEIIDNNCIDEDEEEYIEQEEPKSPIKEKQEEEEGEEEEEREEAEEEAEEENIQKENKNFNNIKEKKHIQPEHIKNKSQKNQNITNYNNNNNKNIEIKKPQKNKFQSYYSPKFDFARRKHKTNEEVKSPDDLFIKAMEKNKTKNESKNESNKEYDLEGNTLSTKVTDILYDKYIGQNGRKLKTIDVISKMKDEEVRVNRAAMRTKEDAKKISDMLNRQEDFEKLKINKLKEKEKEINDKVSQVCVFMPNGINTSTRTPEDFYNSQIEFVEKKEDKINQIYKNIIDNENKNMNMALTSKLSEKIASGKNPNESKEDFCKRLHYEKLKKGKESIKKPKEEKKLTKEQIKNLSDKLYKEGQTFRDNKDKKIKERILKEMNSNKEDYISEKSNKVLLSKFISYYEKILLEIFNRSDNFQISFDEYKQVLNNLGCINPNSQIDEELIKESFYKYLKPQEEKIDTHAFLVFGLTCLGIYKGNDEIKKQSANPSINPNNINRNIEPQKFPNKLNNNSRKNNNTTQKLKTSSELIKISMPNLDLNKYGYTNKTTKIIKQKFLPFVKGLNGSWVLDITKKKNERKEKLEETLKKNENKKIYKTVRNNKSDNNKLEDVYQIIQQKKENDLKTLKAKKEAEELALCTFHPHINKPNNTNKNINRKQINKNIEKLYQEGKAAYIQKKKLIDHDPEDNDENKINCTFKPVINQYNNEMFIKNPLKEDLQRFEKLREQKMNNNNKEYEKPMNFAIESKINKEDIFDRIIPDKSIYKNEINEDIKKDIPPLLKVEVNLDEKNNTDKIIIYPGDDIKEKTIQFCLKHKLSEEKKNTLLNIILDKMNENKEEEDNDELYEEKEEENNDNNENENNNNLNNEENKNTEEHVEDNQQMEDNQECSGIDISNEEKDNNNDNEN